jgi:hypothetical protein
MVIGIQDHVSGQHSRFIEIVKCRLAFLSRCTFNEEPLPYIEILFVKAPNLVKRLQLDRLEQIE